MGRRVLGRQSASIALVLVALAGCVTEPLPSPVTVPAPAAASSEQLRWAVEAALAARHWTVRERAATGSITAFVQSQGTGEQATIEIAYRPGTIDIRSVKQAVSRQRYDRWIQLLSSEIQKNVAQLGMGKPLAAAPAAPPADAPPAPAPPAPAPPAPRARTQPAPSEPFSTP